MNHFPKDYQQRFLFGATDSGFGNRRPAIRAEEAWAIDTKLDDGRPAFGDLFARPSGVNPGCTTSDTATVSEYNLTNNAIACSLIFDPKI